MINAIINELVSKMTACYRFRYELADIKEDSML